MTSIELSSNNPPGRVVCPGSKSYANRALILAALSERSVLKNLPGAEDTLYLMKGLERLGVLFNKQYGECEVLGGLQRLRPPKEEIYLGEGGTTIRFFMALAGLLPFPVKMRVAKAFLERPLAEYKKLLESLGARVSVAEDSIEVCGPYTAEGEVAVDCSKTTQFASALELISPRTPFTVNAVNVTASKKYLDMTESVKARMDKSFAVPADFSSLGYFAAYAALTAPVTVTNVQAPDPLQADTKILEVIERLGGSWESGVQGLSVYPVKNFNSIEVDGSSCLDLVPTLAFLLAYSGKKQVIRNVANLRFKESDRLQAIMELLAAFEVEAVYDGQTDVLLIQGRRPDHIRRSYKAPRDHRMVMSAALFIKLNGGGELAPAEAVNKSFPEFFNWFV